MNKPWDLWPLSGPLSDAEAPQPRRLAEGEYRYFRDGELMPVREYWQALSGGNGNYWRSFRQVAELDLQLRVEYWPNSHCELQWLQAGETIRKRYACEQGLWSCADHETVSAEPIFHPLMRVFTAATLREVDATAGTAAVLLPDIRPHIDAAARLEPHISERTTRFLGRKLMPAVADCLEAELLAYHYLGEQYGSDGDACFYIEDAAVTESPAEQASLHCREPLLAGYDWQAADGLWQVRLLRWS